MVVTFDFPTLDIRPITLSLPMSKIITQMQQLSLSPTITGIPERAFCLSTFDFRPSTFGLLLIFSFFILRCGLDVEDPTPPSPPVWVQKSLPEEWPERGIDAHESGGIFLEWETSPEEGVFSYHIYRAIWDEVIESLGEFEMISSFETAALQKYGFVDDTVVEGTKYCYKCKAKGVSGSLSDYSEPAYYRLFPSIRLDHMFPNGSASELAVDRQLSWSSYNNIISMENYCLTLLDDQNNLILRIQLYPNDYVGNRDYFSLPQELPLQNGKTYRWRIDIEAGYVEGRENTGSESMWASFLYKDLLFKRSF